MIDLNSLDKIVPVGMAAAAAGVHCDTVRRWIREGKIKGYGRKGCLRVNLAELFPEVQPSGLPQRISPNHVQNRILIGLPIDEACAMKSARRQDLVVNPLEALDGELLDAINYAREAHGRGWPVAEISEDLRRLCERVRLVYRMTGGNSL